MTSIQVGLIALLTYIQVSRDQCGYAIDVDVLRQTAADAGVTFQTPEQITARENGFREAERQFVGMRRPVECAYALAQYGPSGAKMPGLIAKRPEP